MSDQLENTEKEVEELHRVITKCRTRHDEQSDLLQKLNKDDVLKSTASKKPKLATDSGCDDRPSLKTRFDDLARTYQEWEMEITPVSTPSRKSEIVTQPKSSGNTLSSRLFPNPLDKNTSSTNPTPVSVRKATPYKVQYTQLRQQSIVVANDQQPEDEQHILKDTVTSIPKAINEPVSNKENDSINETPITRRRVRDVAKLFENNAADIPDKYPIPSKSHKVSFMLADNSHKKDKIIEVSVDEQPFDSVDNLAEFNSPCTLQSIPVSTLSALSPSKLPTEIVIDSESVSNTADFDLCAEMNMNFIASDQPQQKLHPTEDKPLESNEHYADEVSNIFSEALGYEEDSDLDDPAVPDIIQNSYTVSSSRKIDFSSAHNERRSISNPCSPNAKDISVKEFSRCKSTDCIAVSSNITAENASKIKEMESGLMRIELAIDQASSTLRHCRGGHFALCDQIECSRVLLSACHRKQAILEEIARLQHTEPGQLDLPLAIVSLNTIRLPLDPDYMNALASGQDKRIFFVTCYVHYRSDVIQTTLCSTAEIVLTSSASSPCMIFTNHMNFYNLSPDFQIKIYIYCLEKRIKGNIKNFRELRSKAKGSFRKLLKTAKETYGANNREVVGRFVNFVQVDVVKIERKHINQNKFPLKLSSSKFPFVGHLMLCSEFRLAELVSHSGFLTHHSIVGGLGVWQRYWCVLENTKLRLWKNPEDCDHKSQNTPNRVLPLSMCKPRSVRILPFDECARPHTIEILMTASEPEDIDKHWFAADTTVDSNIWVQKLTKAIDTSFYWSAICQPNM
ncbi:hypothetical protein GJ496_001521 [Pomphorhynchus laevis]|nr:hypothetical protein GJ496_001521 [Pomphorhynchus laevis]